MKTEIKRPPTLKAEDRADGRSSDCVEHSVAGRIRFSLWVLNISDFLNNGSGQAAIEQTLL